MLFHSLLTKKSSQSISDALIISILKSLFWVLYDLAQCCKNFLKNVSPKPCVSLGFNSQANILLCLISIFEIFNTSNTLNLFIYPSSLSNISMSSEILLVFSFVLCSLYFSLYINRIG